MLQLFSSYKACNNLVAYLLLTLIGLWFHM
nr:MAG TPA: hypothetical protein [Bacteriophage sp.]